MAKPDRFLPPHGITFTNILFPTGRLDETGWDWPVVFWTKQIRPTKPRSSAPPHAAQKRDTLRHKEDKSNAWFIQKTTARKAFGNTFNKKSNLRRWHDWHSLQGVWCKWARPNRPCDLCIDSIKESGLSTSYPDIVQISWPLAARNQWSKPPAIYSQRSGSAVSGCHGELLRGTEQMSWRATFL